MGTTEAQDSRHNFKKIKFFIGRSSESNRCKGSSEVGRVNHVFTHSFIQQASVTPCVARLFARMGRDTKINKAGLPLSKSPKSG